MTDRANSLRLIAWVLIVLGGLNLIQTTIMINDDATLDLMRQRLIPIQVQFVLTYIGSLIEVACGVLTLKGRIWARTPYVVWSAIGIAIGFAISPSKSMLIPGLALFLLIAILLFRPKSGLAGSNDYHSESQDTD